MNINIQNINARDESCTICGKPATIGKYVTGEFGTEAVDFGVFFCDNHRHLSDRAHIEDFVIDVMEG